jgi:hypothetical protein
VKLSFNSLEKAEFIYSEEEQAKLNEIAGKISQLQHEATQLTKEFARKGGIIAADLHDLKAADGSSFAESKTDPGTAKAADGGQAYLCAGFHGHNPDEGCGWVKGLPRRQEYQDFSICSGSAGYQLFCVICGTELQEIELIRS